MSKSPAQGGLRCLRGSASKKCLTAVLLVTVLAVSCLVLINEYTDDSDATTGYPANNVYVTTTSDSQVHLSRGGTSNAWGTNSIVFSYENGESVLTFTNVNQSITGGSCEFTDTYGSTCYAAIYADGNLTIRFVGTNVLNYRGVSSGEVSDNIYGIYVEGDLTIENDSSANTRLQIQTRSSTKENAGIYCWGDLTIRNDNTASNQRLWIESYSQAPNAPYTMGQYEQYGVYSLGSISISKTHIYAGCGDIEDSPICRPGLLNCYGIWTWGTLTVDNDSYVGAYQSDIEFSGYGSVYAIENFGVFSNGLVVSDHSRLFTVAGNVYRDTSKTFHDGNGVYNYGIKTSNMTVSGESIVNAKAGAANIPAYCTVSESAGLVAGDISVSEDSTIDATGSVGKRHSYGIKAASLNVTGGTVRGSASYASYPEDTESIGIQLSNNLTASGGTITGTGGYITYTFYTIGIRVGGIIDLSGTAYVKGIGGDSSLDHEERYGEGEFDIMGEHEGATGTGNSYGIYLVGGNHEVDDDAVLEGIGGTLETREMAYGGDDIMSYGIFIRSYGASNQYGITGSGTVKATGGNILYSHPKEHIEGSIGLYSYKSLTLSGITALIKGGDVSTVDNPLDAYDGSITKGLSVNGNLQILNDANITAAGGKNCNYCIMADQSNYTWYNDSWGVEVKGNLTVSDGSTLNANATSSPSEKSTRMIGLYITGAITVTGDGSSIIAYAGESDNTGHAGQYPYDIAERTSHGIFQKDSDSITISDGGRLSARGYTKAISTTGTLTSPFIVYSSNVDGSDGSTTTTSLSPGSYKFIDAMLQAYRISVNLNGATGIHGETGEELEQFWYGSGFVLPEWPVENYYGPDGTFKKPDNITYWERYFNGWRIGNAGSGDIYQPGTEMDVLSDIVLYPQWKDGRQTIACYTNGNTVDTKYRPIHLDIVDYTLPVFFIRERCQLPGENPDHTSIAAPAHMKFKCWLVDGEERASNYTFPFLHQMTIYAVYEVDPDDKYTVSFDPGDGTGEMGSQQIVWSQTYVLPNCTFTAPQHKQFRCWEIGGEEYAVGAEITVTAAVTVTALWEDARYNVSFNSNTGSGSMAPQSIVYNTPTMLKPNVFTKTHYHFIGWATTEGGDVAYQNEDEITITGAVTLYAKWEEDPKYTIVFNSNGGSAVDSQLVYVDSKVIEPGDPTRDPSVSQTFVFAGWYVDEGLTEPYDFDTLVTSGFTLYADWEASPRSYTITFVNYDGTQLQSGPVEYGQTPSYTGATPSKPEDVQYTYTHSGWNPQITPVNGDATYTATFNGITRSYTVRFVNEGGYELQSEILPYGTMPVYKGNMPTKSSTVQYNYTFSGWDPEIVSVAGSATYTATYDAEIRPYTIRFVNYDGTELQMVQVNYGQLPSYSGATPTKVSTPQYDYVHSGWTPTVVAVIGEATYTATYDSHTRSYAITFVNYDGVQLQSGPVEYGQTPSYSGATPLKAADEYYSYTFAGWDPAIVAVTGVATYTATFDSARVQYTISFATTEGGSGSMDGMIVDSGDFVLPANGFIPAAGKVFEGWAYGSASGQFYLADAHCDIHEDVTFFAKWSDHEHHLESIPAVPATCTQDGLTEGFRCTDCGRVIVEQMVDPAPGHNYIEVVTAPTCTEGGYTTHACSRCGDSYVDTYTDALGHIWASAECNWSDDFESCSVTLVCGTCGHREAVPDVTVVHSVKIAATTTSMGVTTYAVTGTYLGFAYSSSKDITNIPALEPEITQKEGTSTYVNTVAEDQDTQVTEIFTTAKNNGGEVEVEINTVAAGSMTIAFDGDAVNAIGASGKPVTIKANVVKDSTAVADAELVIEVTLSQRFENGKAKVTVPFTQAVPEGKVLKVYFINGDQRVDMNATLVDGKVVFETDHFSTYAVFFEDVPSDNNGGGFPIWIVFVIVAVVAVGGGAFLFISKKKA